MMMKTMKTITLAGWLLGLNCGVVFTLMFSPDPIDRVIAAESTYRNITISGDFGEVVIVGDDAEAFLQSEYPVIDITK